MRRGLIGSFIGTLAAIVAAMVLTASVGAEQDHTRGLPAASLGQQFFAVPAAAAATESITIGTNLSLPAGSAAALPATDYYLPNSTLFPNGFTMPAGHQNFVLQLDFKNVPATDDLNVEIQMFSNSTWTTLTGADFQGGFYTNKLGQSTSVSSMAAAIPQSPYPSAFRVHVISCPEIEILSGLLQIT